MVTERVIIQVTETGTRIVSRNLRGVGRDADAAGFALRRLRNALLGVSAALIVRGVVRLADAFTDAEDPPLAAAAEERPPAVLDADAVASPGVAPAELAGRVEFAYKIGK